MFPLKEMGRGLLNMTSIIYLERKEKDGTKFGKVYFCKNYKSSKKVEFAQIDVR